MSRIFDWNKFKDHEECIICLEAFTANDTVTPLPCDKRHYFHSKCIEEWSQSHTVCPICRTEFNQRLIEEAIANRNTLTDPTQMQQ